MNRMKWLVVMCVCFGLAAGSYLVGCSDDDDGLSCADAVAEFLGDDCQAEGAAAAAVLDDCVAGCDDEDCFEACLDDFVDASPACSDAVDKLFDQGDCGECIVDCGDGFFGCLVDGGDGPECLDGLSLCVELCGA